MQKIIILDYAKILREFYINQRIKIAKSSLKDGTAPFA